MNTKIFETKEKSSRPEGVKERRSAGAKSVGKRRTRVYVLTAIVGQRIVGTSIFTTRKVTASCL